MKHTRVPWDGIQGFGGQLSRHYRYQAFTFFEAESGIRLKVKSKTGKSRMDRADRETETQKKKNPHTFPTLKYLNLGRLLRCNVCEKYEPFCKKKKKNQFVSYATSDQTRQLLIRKLCTNINQPYLTWAAVLCHVPPPKNQWYWVPYHNHGEKKNVDVLSMMMTCNGRYSEDEVRPANYTKFN